MTGVYRDRVAVWLDKLDVQVGVWFDIAVARTHSGMDIEVEPTSVEEHRPDEDPVIVADGYSQAVRYITRTWPHWTRAQWAEDAYAELEALL